MAAAPNVLVVEDDRELAALLDLHLTDAHYRTELIHDGTAGLHAACSGRYDLLMLDVMLPGNDGLDICRAVRAQGLDVPILMLTSRSEEFDKVLGLELGADDYVTKPFSIRELLARVKALLRRTASEASSAQDQTAVLTFGELEIDQEKRRVTLGKRDVELTAKEWDLLLLFAQHPGRVYTRQELLDAVWGYQYDGYSHTVNSHINRLRGKIERDPAVPHFIRTKRGMGYHFVDAE
ncbi:MAG: response regulator transcription factor [Rhodothermales bacterium]